MEPKHDIFTSSYIIFHLTFFKELGYKSILFF